jgi:hypothetical protein
MPFFRLDSKADYFPDVEIKHAACAVVPDPDLFGIVTVFGRSVYQDGNRLHRETYNLAPSRRRLGGTRISLKNSMLTVGTFSTTATFHSGDSDS